MNLLENLNENQQKAVQHINGPLLILAGAGSGKTRVITHRIANLILNKHAQPYNIFAVTFTNKAAEEMRSRISNLIGPSGSSVFIKTFHSAGVYMLRRFGERIGIAPSYSIYDRSDQESLIKDILIKQRLDPKKIKPSMICSKISEIKDKAELIDGTDIQHLMPDYHAFDFYDLYKEYHNRLKENNALDFNDLLVKTVELFRSSPETLEELQKRWRYFMIDEYQDTNHAQYLITKSLASASRNICVVGDDDQSIYSWRGADIRNILDFEKDYTEAQTITLDENYRSTQQILDAAHSVIKNNINRKEKKLTTNLEGGEPVLWTQANNEYGEAEFVIKSISSLKHRENFRNSDFSIFYRTNAQSRLFEDHLRKENIPYKVVGGLKFYDRKEIKDILAYCKFISNTMDSISLNRIINTPARGIGKATMDKIKAKAESEKTSDWEVIQGSHFTGKAAKGLAEFTSIIHKIQEMSRKTPYEIKLSKLFQEIVDATKYKKILEEENTIESNGRIDNINELINSVYSFEIMNPESTLDEFLQEISLYTSEENPEADPEDKDNTVTLMTIHNAKGLEFPVVFLTGMEEEIFPHKLASDTDEGIEEERRLCYVGITRAKSRIFLTNAELRRSYAGVFHREPSRFLFEIPDELLVRDSYYSDNFSSSNGGTFQSQYKQPVRETTERSTVSTFYSKKQSDSKFKVSDRVLHPKYGAGRIVKIEGSGDNVKLTIIFGTSMKTFLEKYTPLDKL